MINAIAPLSFFGALVGLIFAACVFLRDPGVRTNRTLAAAFAVLSVHQTTLGVVALPLPGTWLSVSIWATFVSAMLIPPLWLAFGLALGDHAEHVSNPWHRVLPWVVFAGLGLLAFLTLGRSTPPAQYTSASQVLVGMDVTGRGFFAAFVVGLTLVLLHLENVYRRTDRMGRWRIKFLIVGTFVAFTPQVVSASYVVLYGATHPWHPALTALALLIGAGLTAIALPRCPSLRTDVVFLSRYVVCRSLALALVIGYLVSLGAIGKFVEWMGIPRDVATELFLGSVGAAALSLLLLSERVCGGAHRFLHTHCYKQKYDFRLEWLEFTRRLSHATTISDIATHTVRRILEVMWVRRVALYTTTATPNRLALAYHAGYHQLPNILDLAPSEAARLHAVVSASVDPATMDFGVPAPPSLAAFLGSPVGVVLPIGALDTLAGILVIGPEMSGRPFDLDDRDLLTAVAAQTGANIINCQMANEAAEGREFQAYARFSAFVAHDLKNSINMLSMLAENVPQHMHESAFQEDAARTLAQVTAKMQGLLANLDSPHRSVRPEACGQSLAKAVKGWLREISGQAPTRVRFDARLDGILEPDADPEQLRSLLGNLLLNAIEAIPANGTIRVETFDEPGFAVLRITDDGQGMTETFVRERLFRPFQTTKPHGLGIGLYQSLHIVRTYKGTLTVQSQEGHGTQITVRLPSIASSPARGAQPVRDASLRGDAPEAPAASHGMDFAFNRR